MSPVFPAHPAGLCLTAAAATAALAVAGCGAASRSASTVRTGSVTAGSLHITGAYVPMPASPSVAAAYFTVSDSGTADTLLSVTSPVSTDVGLHRTVETGSVGEMVPVGSIAVPAGGALHLAPGGYHVMLIDPRPMTVGQQVRLTLHFRDAGEVTVSAPVVPLTATDDDSSTVSMTGMS